MARAERTDEEAPLPRRDDVAAVDAPAAGGTALTHTSDRGAMPCAASQRTRPATPGRARTRDIHLVVPAAPRVAARPVVRDDERLRVEPVEPLRVAEAEHKDGAAGVGFIRGDPRRWQPEDLAVEQPRSRAAATRAVARTDVEDPVGPEADPAAVVRIVRRDVVEITRSTCAERRSSARIQRGTRFTVCPPVSTVA